MKPGNYHNQQPFTSGQFGSAAAGDQMWGRDPGAPKAQMLQQSTPSYTVGQQMGRQAAQQMGQQFNQPAGQQTFGQTIGQQSIGQTATQQMMGQQAMQQRKYGAMELLMAHEVLNKHIDSINLFELYRPHVKDQELLNVLDSQLNHLYGSYQNMVNYLHNQGMGQAIPYRAPKASAIKYGLRQPSPMEPNASIQYMDDRDVASAILCCAKSSAKLCNTAALECADPMLRNMMMDCAVSSANKAYEIFQYMNQRGLYQVPTLADQTTQTMVSAYQVGQQPQF